MIYFHFAYMFFRKNKLLNFMQALIIAFSALLLFFTLGLYSYNALTQNYISPLASEKSYYFSPVYSISEDAPFAGYDEAFDKELKSLHAVWTAENYGFTYKDKSFSAMAYSGEFLSKVKLRLSKGAWFGDKGGQKDAEAIPVVITKETPELGLGDVATIKSKAGTEESIDVEIIGVLAEPVFIPELNHSGNASIEPDALFLKKGPRSSTNLIFRQGDMTSAFTKDIITQSGRIIIFDDEITPAGLRENLELIGRYGNAQSFQDIYKNGSTRVRAWAEVMLSESFAGFLLGLVGLVGSTVLTFHMHMRDFAICFLSGCRWRKILAVSVCYLLIILATAAAITALLYIGIIAPRYGSSIIITPMCFIVTIGVVLLATLPVLLFPFIRLRQVSPVSVIKNNE